MVKLYLLNIPGKVKFLFAVIAFLHIKTVCSQSVKADFSLSNIIYSTGQKFGDYSAKLGASDDQLNEMHGITYKLSFDPSTIYPDSIRVSVIPEALGLKKGEYLEMQRADSSFVLYSLTVIGKEKTLQLEELPIVLDFAIKPATRYELIANNCEYTIEFKAESVKAYDLARTEIEMEPFVLPIDIECEKQSGTKILVASPNPTKERCWVRIPDERVGDIKYIYFFDMKGERLTLSGKTSENLLEFNLSCLRPGHYFIHIVYSDGERDVVKVAKV